MTGLWQKMSVTMYARLMVCALCFTRTPSLTHSHTLLSYLFSILSFDYLFPGSDGVVSCLDQFG